MLKGELAILEAIALNGDEASVAEIQSRLGGPVTESQIRGRLRYLTAKGNVVWQRLHSGYSLTYQGKERVLNELAHYAPNSPVLVKELGRKKLLVEVEVEPLEEGGYLAVCPSIQGCHAEGITVAEALGNLEDAANVLLELQKREGWPQRQGLKEYRTGKVLKAQLVVSEPG